MAKFMAYGNPGLPYSSRSEHHYSDKATKAQNVKEKCPDRGGLEISGESYSIQCYRGSIQVGYRAKRYFVETGMIVFITLSQKNLFGKILELIFQNSFGQQAVKV